MATFIFRYLLQAHSGYDLPWMSHRIFKKDDEGGGGEREEGCPTVESSMGTSKDASQNDTARQMSVIGGAPCHNKHHNLGNVNFQQFFTYLDKAHGTF